VAPARAVLVFTVISGPPARNVISRANLLLMTPVNAPTVGTPMLSPIAINATPLAKSLRKTVVSVRNVGVILRVLLVTLVPIRASPSLNKAVCARSVGPEVRDRTVTTPPKTT